MKPIQALPFAPSAIAPEAEEEENSALSLPTVISGKVLDQRGLPAENTKISFFGRGLKSNDVYLTFDIVQRIGEDGSFEISTVIPRKTASAILRIESSGYNFFQYSFGVKINGEEIGKPNSVEISSEYYGKKTTVDFQLQRL